MNVPVTEGLYNDDIKIALTYDESLKEIVKYGPQGQHDFRLSANAAAVEGRLILSKLKAIGIEHPSVLEGRTLYMFGRTGGIGLAQALHNNQDSTLMSGVVSEDAMNANRIPKLTTVGQYRDHMVVGDGGMGKLIANRPMEFIAH